jgi:GrpB-like predicted nucleotidyltransferase (UPF0157 family)
MASPGLELVPHDPAWQARFAREASRIAVTIGAHALQIEHVGSTAVPQLLAKPVIDIAVAVATPSAADACIEPLRTLGYEYRGQHGDDPARRYYVLSRDGRRFAQLHLYIRPARGWDEMIRFRDALRHDRDLMAAYAAEKRRVAGAVAWNKAAYAEAKGPFIRGVLDTLPEDAPGPAR